MNPLKKLFQKYSERFGEQLCELPEFRQECAWRAEVSILKTLLASLKREDQFDFLVDISSVDHLGEEYRFEIVYELCRLADAMHLRIKIKIHEKDAVPSVCELWRTANWHEREIYDMMGIVFSEHPDLRRILMWEGYPYYPLRKDFPLEGLPSEMPDVAFSHVTPMEGGPFVTSAAAITTEREPRARPPVL
ncbi:MAG: NADH-quinone oxidoreductase subunit C [Verrucomicrobiota bacterium]